MTTFQYAVSVAVVVVKTNGPMRARRESAKHDFKTCFCTLWPTWVDGVGDVHQRGPGPGGEIGDVVFFCDPERARMSEMGLVKESVSERAPMETRGTNQLSEPETSTVVLRENSSSDEGDFEMEGVEESQRRTLGHAEFRRATCQRKPHLDPLRIRRVQAPLQKTLVYIYMIWGH